MKILSICFFVLALGLASAAPRRSVPNFFYALDTPRKEQSNEVATVTNQVAINIATKIILELVKKAPDVISAVIELLKAAVCDNTDSQLQAFANNEERDADIMGLVRVMNDLLTADEKLDEVKQLKMKGNLIAEAELFDWVDSVKSKLKSAFRKVGAATKKLLCKA